MLGYTQSYTVQYFDCTKPSITARYSATHTCNQPEITAKPNKTKKYELLQQIQYTETETDSVVPSLFQDFKCSAEHIAIKNLKRFPK